MPKNSEEIAKVLREVAKHTTPIDDLIELTRDMVRLEVKYNISSDEFYKKFNKGEMGDKMEIMRWASWYELHRDLKKSLDQMWLKQKSLSVATP
jgi:hypothetical protein